MKKVFITIKGTGDTGDGAPDVVEFSTEGTMDIKDGKTVLYYSEGDNLGVSGVDTTFTVNADGSVVMERSGSLSTRLEIEKGKRKDTRYSTAYGDMYIGVFGESIENNLTDAGGGFKMTYTLDQNLQEISKNIIEITVKEV